MPEGAGSGNGAATSTFVPDEGSVEQLISFGFTRPQCVKALKSTGGSLERAADWLFSHPDDTGKITSLTKFSSLGNVLDADFFYPMGYALNMLSRTYPQLMNYY